MASGTLQTQIRSKCRPTPALPASLMRHGVDAALLGDARVIFNAPLDEDLVELAHFRIGIKISVFLGKERARQPSLRHETSSRHGQRQERERCWPHITPAVLCLLFLRLGSVFLGSLSQDSNAN